MLMTEARTSSHPRQEPNSRNAFRQSTEVALHRRKEVEKPATGSSVAQKSASLTLAEVRAREDIILSRQTCNTNSSANGCVSKGSTWTYEGLSDLLSCIQPLLKCQGSQGYALESCRSIIR